MAKNILVQNSDDSKSDLELGISRKIPVAHNFKNLTGQKFGRLTVIKFAYRQNRVTKWECLCDCGNRSLVIANNLKKGHTKSCGCLNAEMVSKRQTTHGLSHDEQVAKEYSAWVKMKSRCNSVNDYKYHNYGARGIKVCKEWSDSFEAFYEYMGSAPSQSHSVGRINNDGNYEPGNVRWETSKEQANNKRSTRFISFNGKTQSLKDWSAPI